MSKRAGVIYLDGRFGGKHRRLQRKSKKLRDDEQIMTDEFLKEKDVSQIPDKYKTKSKLLRRTVVSLTGLALLVSCSDFDGRIENQRQIYLNDNYVASDFYADN